MAYGFHETKQGVRYTISEAARREVLGRLLLLNHQRYAEEVARGLHEKGTNTKKGQREGKLDGKEGKRKGKGAVEVRGALLFDEV